MNKKEVLKKIREANKRAEKREKEAEKHWFKPRKLYRKGGEFANQPFETFKKLTYPKARHALETTEKKIQRNVEERMKKGENPNVLEIGPGPAPFQSPIRTSGQKVYLDVQEQFLKDKGKAAKIKHDVTKGHLPFKDKAFGPTIINEVLTHVEPQKRTKVIEEITRVSDEVMITDRYIEGKKSEKAVNPEKLQKELTSKGFEVEIKKVKLKELLKKRELRYLDPEVVENAGYFVIHAKKRKKK